MNHQNSKLNEVDLTFESTLSDLVYSNSNKIDHSSFFYVPDER